MFIYYYLFYGYEFCMAITHYFGFDFNITIIFITGVIVFINQQAFIVVQNLSVYYLVRINMNL